MENIYADIAARTGGNIYIGVVGPVRTGKSTLVKRIMEELVIPCIDDPYRFLPASVFLMTNWAKWAVVTLLSLLPALVWVKHHLR